MCLFEKKPRILGTDFDMETLRVCGRSREKRPDWRGTAVGAMGEGEGLRVLGEELKKGLWEGLCGDLEGLKWD